MSWPVQVGVLPPRAVGRLDRPVDVVLQTAVEAGGEMAIVVCQVLAGMGGVGKTQLATSVAHRWWRDHRVDLLIWATATSRTSVITRYAQAAADITGVDDPDPDTGVQRLLSWLASSTRRWLIVLDDLTDPEDLQGLWPPLTPTGRTIVTTRRRDHALLAGRTLIDVDLFTPDQAVTYLRGKLGDQPYRLDEATALAEDLGHLPLALAQAAAYIVDQDLTCAGYRRRLTRRRLHTLRPAVLPDDQSAAVADTWGLSIDLADAATGGTAGILLQLAALLDPNGIPHALFTTTAVLTYCAARTGQPVESDDLHDACTPCTDSASSPARQPPTPTTQPAWSGSMRCCNASSAKTPPPATSATSLSPPPTPSSNSGPITNLTPAPHNHYALTPTPCTITPASTSGPPPTRTTPSCSAPATASAAPAWSQPPATTTSTYTPPPPSISARTTPTPSPPAATSPTGGVRPGTRPGPQPRSTSCCWPTICGCSARTTPTQCDHAG